MQEAIFGEFYYHSPLQSLSAFDSKQLQDLLAQIDTQRHSGYFVGYVHYHALSASKSTTPIAYFTQFAKRQTYTPKPLENMVFYPQIDTPIDFNTYAAQFKAIQKSFEDGECAQVNLTLPLHLKTHTTPRAIFEQVLRNQHTPYCAFLPSPFETILSFSPELFFDVDYGRQSICVKPMKGTIARGITPEQDAHNREFLQSDPKNRHENTMVVDLFAQELAQIAHNIEVTKLCEVEAHPTLFQMTSTLVGTLKNPQLLPLLQAIFPSSSVTGEPKQKSMRLIEDLEKHDRGVYCGAIGVVDAHQALFNVPIRTMCAPAQSQTYTLCVGSGVTQASQLESEYQECHLKSFFILPKMEFSLIETMLVRHLEICHRDLHAQRLKNSARYFNFTYDRWLEHYQPTQDGILRLEWHKDGSHSLEYSPLEPPKSTKLLLAPKPLDPHNDFLTHKTTYTPWYEEARALIAKGLCFDVLHYTSEGRLTEGARSNLILELEGQLYTPKFGAGLLKGVGVTRLVEAGHCTPKELSLEDLKRADKIYATNAIRGMVELRLDTPML
ncbi:bifunctional chorismate-binding protein/class IV aminotransferase [Helicobacter baculiformis]|uniref:Bifunctional chorismate-binding protein/class IV aminotransferase n=1 Tax=Helicobacter baculiformis TaxID=427351 RepID=A0ABV7ZLH9_9HELI|nr:bifunctional chorismate-binding protein/class IV aminotransferase [Helicobacter baculiformis]